METQNFVELFAFHGRPREFIANKYWHGTCCQIADSKFLPFTHFGTEKQAGLGLARSATRVYKLEYVEYAWRETLEHVISTPPGASEGAIYEVCLSMQRPLRIEDTEEIHDSDTIARLIDSTEFLVRKLRSRVGRINAETDKQRIIIQELIASGYDGPIYANTGEGLNH